MDSRQVGVVETVDTTQVIPGSQYPVSVWQQDTTLASR